MDGISSVGHSHMVATSRLRSGKKGVLGRNLDKFDLAHLIFAKLNVAMVLALELKLSKTLRWLGYFVLKLSGDFASRVNTVRNTQAPSEFLTTSIPKQKP